MSRNVALPLLGLIGIVLFSLNQLSRPVDVEPGGFAEPIVLEDEWDEPAPRPALSATPPPAPRLQSEVQTADVLEADAPVPQIGRAHV